MMRKSYLVSIPRSTHVHNNNPLSLLRGRFGMSFSSSISSHFSNAGLLYAQLRAKYFPSSHPWFMVPRAHCVHIHDTHPRQTLSHLLATIRPWCESSHHRGTAGYMCRLASSAAIQKGPTYRNSRRWTWVRSCSDERNSVDSAWVGQ